MLNQDRLMKSSMILLLLMILGMVAIGGITRLTGAGLSIVEWKPIVGILPPFTVNQWLAEFSRYQQSPEFLKINFGMTLAEFQSIFWLEYIHRLWGRLIGVVLILPTVLIFIKKEYRYLCPFVILLWILGASQGVMGWLMVKSGLSGDPHVSPYRLAAHLMLGFSIFGVALWMSLLLLIEQKNVIARSNTPRNVAWLINSTLILVLVTAFLGAFVAGHKAGLVYNTFPLMGNSFIPQEFLTTTPWYVDLFENPVSVQFVHRCFAIITFVSCLLLWQSQKSNYLFTGIAICALIQVALGISTLLLIVPTWLATLHQVFAFVLFGFLVSARFLLKSSSKGNKVTVSYDEQRISFDEKSVF